MFLIVIILVFVVVGAWSGSALFQSKNRNPSVGGLIGGLAGIIPIFLIIFLVVAFVLPKLEEGQDGYFSTDIIKSKPYLSPQYRQVESSPQLVQSTAPASLPTANKDSVTDKLKEAKALLDQGLIDEEEFKTMKNRIINS